MISFVLLSFTLWTGPADIKTVSNGQKGKGGTLVLTEDLRLGPEDGDDYFLWSGPNVAVSADQKGNMYIVDDRENRIIVLDKNGTFKKQIGRPGEGPGEFKGLRSFHLLNDGGAIAYDNLQTRGSLSFFNGDMEFVSKQNFPVAEATLNGLNVSPTGRWYMGDLTNAGDPGKNVFYDVIFSKDWKPKHELQSHQQSAFDSNRVFEPEYWMEILGERIRNTVHGNDAFITFGPNGEAYTAIARSYEVTKWNTDMGKEMVITRKHKPIPMTDAEIQAIADPVFEAVLAQLPEQIQKLLTQRVIQGAIEKAEFPPAKVPIYGLRVTDKGTLMVIHDVSLATGRDTADLFDSKGQFLGSYTHANEGLLGMTFKNGHAYTIEKIDEENILVRYKVEERF